MSTPQPGASFAQSHRTMMGALASAPLLLGVIVAVVLPVGDPEPLLIGVVLVAGAAVAALVPQVGYRLTPLERGRSPEESARSARDRYQPAAMIRFALAEFPMLLGLVLAFVDQSLVHGLVGVVLTLGLMGLHVWPSRRVVERSADALEADGVDSGLRREFGLTQF